MSGHHGKVDCLDGCPETNVLEVNVFRLHLTLILSHSGHGVSGTVAEEFLEGVHERETHAHSKHQVDGDLLGNMTVTGTKKCRKDFAVKCLQSDSLIKTSVKEKRQRPTNVQLFLFLFFLRHEIR